MGKGAGVCSGDWRVVQEAERGAGIQLPVALKRVGELGAERRRHVVLIIGEYRLVDGSNDERPYDQGLEAVPGAAQAKRDGAGDDAWIEIVLLRIADEHFELADAAQLERRPGHGRPAVGISLLAGDVYLLQVAALIEPALQPDIEAFAKFVARPQ